MSRYCCVCSCFFFNDPATTEIYTLSLHDALPISLLNSLVAAGFEGTAYVGHRGPPPAWARGRDRVELGSRTEVVDRKSTRLNSSHANISYAVFCLKKKHTTQHHSQDDALVNLLGV